MRILLVGESAAGHLAPIIAVYEEIKNRKKELNLDSLEFMLLSYESHFLKEMLEGVDLPYKTIKSARRSSSPLQPIINFFYVIIGFIQSLSFIFGYMPDVVFSKGGKVSLPVILVSWVFRIPIIIHESDSVARPIDKFLFRFAKKVAVSFEDSKDIYTSPKVFFSGNPVRNFITGADKEKAIENFVLNREKPIVLIMGGSEGARKINNLVIEVLPELLARYQIIHQCGVVNYNEVKSTIENMNIPNLNNYHLFPFFKKSIADAYVACDLVVSRAGANTVSEILAVDKPSILIPLSTAVSDKQQKNAFHYSQSGAAILLSEKNLKPHLLLNVINEIFQSHLKIIEMQRAARQLAKPEAAKKIVEQIIEIAK